MDLLFWRGLLFDALDESLIPFWRTFLTVNQMENSLDYRAAGVDIDAGNALVERIKPIALRTRIPGVMGGLGQRSSSGSRRKVGSRRLRCSRPLIVVSAWWFA